MMTISGDDAALHSTAERLKNLLNEQLGAISNRRLQMILGWL